MAEAGLFTATNLRIYYASPAEGGFTLTHARYGHGVGMSQRGAQQMANEGKTYRDILAYYYGGATLASYAYTLPEELEQDGGDPSGPAEPQTASARVKGSAVNLRKGPSAASASLATLRSSTILTVSGLSGEWYAVRVDATGQTGYIHSDYVAVTSDAALARGQVNASAVNIRTGPSTGYGSLGKLERGAAVTIRALEDGWYRVRVDATGQAGYIIRNYVTVTSAAATPPPATPAATPVPAATPIPVPVQSAPGASAAPSTATPSPAGDGPVPVSPAPGGATPAPASPAPTASPSAFAAYGQINAMRVNFRKGPSTSTASMGKLDRPEALGIYEKQGNWYRVRVLSLDKDGYVYAKYVTLTGGAAGGADGDMGGGEINASAVNIRTGPSTSYASLGRLERRTALTILGSEGSWYRVRVEESGLEGYVFGKYVTLHAAGDGDGGAPSATGQGVVNTGLLSLRSEPGSDSALLAAMRIGYTVTVHSISGEWAYVTYNGRQGYCVAKCLIME